MVAVAGPQLTFTNGAFKIMDGPVEETVALSAGAPPVDFTGDRMSMDVGGVLVTFDQRGLGIQYGKQGGFTGLTYMPTTPKLFSSQEIAHNVELIESGERTARVSALSGFVVVKDRLYLLLRWDDKDGQPWLETLVDVDTSGEAPKVGLLARLAGYSFARGRVSDRLHAAGDTVFVLTRGGEGLSMESYDTLGKSTSLMPLGTDADTVGPLGSRFLTVRGTPYGTKILGVFDPSKSKFREFFETRGEVVPSGLRSAVVLREAGAKSLFDVSSGAKLAITDDSGFAQASLGVLVWSPAAAPRQATLYAPDGWAPLAQWKDTTRG